MRRRHFLAGVGVPWAVEMTPARGHPSGSLRAAGAEYYGARGDGRSDDSAALATGLAAAAARGGGALRLSPGRTYRLTTQLVIPSRCGLVGDGSSMLYAPAEHFDNADPRVRDAPRAAIINMSGELGAPYLQSLGPYLQGVRIRSEVRPGRFINAIVARNVRDLRIVGCDVSGLPMGMAIRAASLAGHSVIHGNYIHDCTDDSVPATGTVPQMTAIEVDNDRVDNRPSMGFRITGNRIANLTVGPALEAAVGWQTDGIHIHQWSSGYIVAHNIVSHVGEGIDVYGREGVIADNILTDCRIFGIKLINGARLNRVSGNIVRRAGKAGITVWGSTLAGAGHTELNLVSGNLISEVNPAGALAADDTACFLTGGRGHPWQARDNRFTGNVLDPGPRCGWAILPAADGTGNTFDGNMIAATSALGQTRPPE